MTQSLNDESRKHIDEIAGEALVHLESIAETARGKLHDGRTLGSEALASINTMTSSSATRAATYLGVTCQDTLPSAIESLRPHFCQDWQQGD
ncbi:hypothetical protein P0E69_08750 [Chimaeribacter arupi]|uniref:hypothetical protein n=1 Tax=Chimaeribacter arupi TaxID=2060066 RepID=UPI002711DDF5|nr:hypothetical protein [Chimaeribacter arupi]WKZ93946.1 hypothetical protein P0E69_08750 [Chimaeribacter arupi]